MSHTTSSPLERRRKMDKHDWTPQMAPLNQDGCSLWANCDSKLWSQGCFILRSVLFLGRAACGILVPQPGIEPGPSAVKAPSPNHWTAREFPPRVVLKTELIRVYTRRMWMYLMPLINNKMINFMWYIFLTTIQNRTPSPWLTLREFLGLSGSLALWKTRGQQTEIFSSSWGE